MNPPADLTHVIWRKANRSQQNGACVEIAVVRGEKGRRHEGIVDRLFGGGITIRPVAVVPRLKRSSRSNDDTTISRYLQVVMGGTMGAWNGPGDAAEGSSRAGHCS